MVAASAQSSDYRSKLSSDPIQSCILIIINHTFPLRYNLLYISNNKKQSISVLNPIELIYLVLSFSFYSIFW